MSALPVIAFLVIAGVSLVVVRVGARALAMTGLSQDAASFQATSAFFGVGFTTREAEMVVNHPVRRRVIMHLIIAGNIGVVSLVGALVVTFVKADTVTTSLRLALALVLGLLVLAVVSSRQAVKRLVDRWIERSLARAGVVRPTDYELLLRFAHGYCVSNFEIDAGHSLIGDTIAQAGLGRRGVVVLGIERHDGTYVGAPDGHTTLQERDMLTIYGLEKDVRALRRGDTEPAAIHPGIEAEGEHGAAER